MLHICSYKNACNFSLPDFIFISLQCPKVNGGAVCWIILNYYYFYNVKNYIFQYKYNQYYTLFLCSVPKAEGRQATVHLFYVLFRPKVILFLYIFISAAFVHEDISNLIKFSLCTGRLPCPFPECLFNKECCHIFRSDFQQRVSPSSFRESTCSVISHHGFSSNFSPYFRTKIAHDHNTKPSVHSYN